MSEPVLQINRADAFYDDLQIVQGASLTLDSGVTSIVGRNGMGKTTLMKAIMGLVRVRGSIKFCGSELVGLKPYQIAKKGIGYVPQGRRNFPSLTVDEHLEFCACNPKNLDSDSIWNKEKVYELFPRLYERQKLSGTSLSGGEQQMLAIGRALVLNPKLLILDEPSEGLAPTIIDLLVKFFSTIQGKSINILLVEQDLNFCERVTDSTNVMSNGDIVYSGSLKSLRSNKELCRKILGVG